MNLRPEWPVLAVSAVLLVLSATHAVKGWRHADRRDRTALASRLVLALLVVGIGLRPTAMHRVEVPVESTTDLVVLLDRTASMGALDADGRRPRIEAAADDLVDLVVGTRGANVTVVVFDDDARVAVPTTTDATAVATFLRTVGWRPSAKATGSDISVGVDTAATLLAELAAEHPDRSRLLVYAGDGEQTQNSEPASFAPLGEHLDDSLVLGYGTERGGPMPLAPGDEETVTREGREQLSRIDQSALRAIADELGADYLHRHAGGALPEFAVSRSGRATELRSGREYHWWLALAGLPFLLHLCARAVTGLRTAREEAR